MTVSLISAQAASTCCSAGPLPRSRLLRRRNRMVAGPAKITNNTAAIAVQINVRPQPAPAACPGSAGCSLGATDGSAPGDASLSVASEVGLAEGSEPDDPAFCTVHGGAEPVTPAGVGSKRTQP